MLRSDFIDPMLVSNDLCGSLSYYINMSSFLFRHLYSTESLLGLIA